MGTTCQINFNDGYATKAHIHYHKDGAPVIILDNLRRFYDNLELFYKAIKDPVIQLDPATIASAFKSWLQANGSWTEKDTLTINKYAYEKYHLGIDYNYHIDHSQYKQITDFPIITFTQYDDEAKTCLTFSKQEVLK